MTSTITKCLSVDNRNEDGWAIWTATLDLDLNIVEFAPESLTSDEIASIKLVIIKYRTKIVSGGFV